MRALRALRERVGTAVGRGPAARFLERLVAVNALEAATRLAAQAFLTALPLLMVVAAFVPDTLQNLLADSLRSVVGVRGDVLDQVRRTFTGPGAAKTPSGAVGLLVTLVSATAFSRALQAVCERCWGLPRATVRVAAWRWLLWLLVWLAALLVQAPLRRGFGTGVVSGLVLSLLSTALLWWWTQHLLLSARVSWAHLLPGAVLAGTGTVLLGYLSRLLMPVAMARGLADFGPLGPVFTLLTWLIVVFLVAVAGLAAGPAVASSAWYARTTRLLRGREPADGREPP
ncbi:YhjD/YihY/BrkB family envelope integrity protein [Streptomyces sp. S465]|uniref:YhjD/YihY/BrkB family envelope integrity protein n=1 Tax=Streptomyces sp. S465 TaxID=2979468 RepID=UPI0022A8C6A2|nr:YhjD/YihY/BrkB family envelope integrity protein [Streptomyces sp. S465]WAP58446.1 YihY/virulence factor BrkB family protein [Streptomyces sp. S465]